MRQSCQAPRSTAVRNAGIQEGGYPNLHGIAGDVEPAGLRSAVRPGLVAVIAFRQVWQVMAMPSEAASSPIRKSPESKEAGIGRPVQARSRPPP
jgi:hypothetical protein